MQSQYYQAPIRSPVRRRGPLALLLLVSVLVLFFSLLEFSQSDSALRGATLAPSIVGLLWLGCYLSASTLAFGTPYLFASAYVLCLFVFHFGLLVQDGFGLTRVLDWAGPIGPWAVRAGWVTNFALGCFGVGFAAYTLRYRPRRAQSTLASEVVTAQNLSWLWNQGVGLLIASLVLLALAIATQGNIFALTRLKLFFLSDTRFISVFSMMIPSAAIALVIAAESPRQRLVAYSVAVLTLAFFLLAGQRSAALFPLLTGVVLWAKVGRRINPMMAGAVLLGSLLVIPIVGYLRTIGTYGQITNANAISEAAQYADIGAAFGEMGGSIGALMYTLMIIPEDEPYRYGRTYLKYLMDVVPNVGLNPDESTSRAAAAEKLSSGPAKEALLDMEPGDWASFHIIREQFQSGGGAGFSGVAEPYFNFGLPGVFVFFIALGVLLGRFDCVAVVYSERWLLFAAVIYWHLLPTVRNGLAIFLKPGVFTLIVLFAWKLVRRFVPLPLIAGGVRPRTLRR